MANELSTKINLALTQAKRAEREARILKQMLGDIRDNLQPTEGTRNESESQDRK